MRPDRRSGAFGLGVIGGHRRRGIGQVRHGHGDAQVEPLVARGSDRLNGAPRGQEVRDHFDRTHRRRAPDALDPVAGQMVEALEGERQMRSPFAARQRVYLVDDHGVDIGEGVAHRRGEHEEQGLRRRDQDVGGMGRQTAPLRRCRVSGADPDTHGRQVGVEPRQACQGAAQVALDVDGERLERGDVENTGTRRPIGISSHEPVDRP